MSLWPLFGAVNQSLAALALIVITIYLKGRTKWGWMVSTAPAVFMLVVSLWATIDNQLNFIAGHNLVLEIINFIIIISLVWIGVEGAVIFVKTKYTDNLMESEMRSAS